MSDFFDIAGMQENLATCVQTNEVSDSSDVKLRDYLDGYKHINMFFNLMGTIFGFVSRDLQAKMDILRGYLDEKMNGSHYETVMTMMEYERVNGLLEKNTYVSGSRTLLRLHRGLDFIRTFLKRIIELRDEEGTVQACREAYNSTLAAHHTFFIRQGAYLAMYAMPSRQQLFLNVCCGDKELIERSLRLLPASLDTIARVYDIVDALYVKYDMHNLP